MYTKVCGLLNCESGSDNCEDEYIVATKTANTIFGHVPCTVSCIFNAFLCYCGFIICIISGNR